jgi:hypothetical protein
LDLVVVYLLLFSIHHHAHSKLVLRMFDRVMEVTQRDRTFPIVLCATQVDNEFKRYDLNFFFSE